MKTTSKSKKEDSKKSAVKKRAGRPTKKVPKYLDRLFDNLREGMSIEASCTQAGLARSTVDQWRREDPKFNQEFESACDFAEAVLLAQIKQTGMMKEDWRAYAWILERRFPGRWSQKRELDLSVNEKKADGNDLVVSMIQQASENMMKDDQNEDS